MSSLVEKLEIVESVVKAPLYHVIGYTHGRLVYLSNAEGITDLWSTDPETGKSKRIAEDVYWAASTRRESPLVVFTKDVSRGRELQQVYGVDCRGGEEMRFEGMEPRRIFGFDFDGEIVGLSAASERAVELWVARPGERAEKVYETSALLFATDVGYGKIVGQGVLRGDPKAYELFFFDIDSSEFSVYTPREGSTNKSPRIRGDKILFATTAFGEERLAVYDISRERLEEPEFSYRDYEKYEFAEYVAFDWTPEGKIWFIGKAEGRTRAFVDGREIPLPEGFSTGLALGDGKVYADHSSLSSPFKIYEVDLDRGEPRAMLGAELPREVAARIGKSYLARYRAPDGVEVPTYVVESAVAPKPGPTVVYVHGGPWSEVADRWSATIAALVACGYHVVAPNFRGSTGYGEEFRRMDIGDPGGGDLLDVAQAAQWARESGLASKLAIMGYSYGGFMTFLATVKRPELWDAGVAGAGIVDWEEMYELSDAIFKRFIEVLFAGRKELWRDRSAINYAENLRAPLCIVHPQNDTRTPLRPVLRYVSKLLELGKTFELHVAPDMGHVIRKMEDALKILLPAVLFLEKYLGK